MGIWLTCKIELEVWIFTVLAYHGGMIRREITDELLAAAKEYPVVTVLGPRQSGKTTLMRSVFPRHAYASLEEPDVRGVAQADPRGFLSNYGDGGGVVLDEIQRVPQLLSYYRREAEGYSDGRCSHE